MSSTIKIQKEPVQPEAIPLQMVSQPGWYEVKLSTIPEVHRHPYREGDILFLSDGFVVNLTLGFIERFFYQPSLMERSGIVDVIPLSGVKITIELRTTLGSVQTYKDE